MFYLDNIFESGGVSVVQEIVHRDAVSVEVEMYVGTERYTTVGVARRHPTDKFNKEIGLKLAYARALKQLANKLDKQVLGQQKHLEDVAVQKELQKTRRYSNQKWTGILNRTKSDPNNNPWWKHVQSYPTIYNNYNNGTKY